MSTASRRIGIALLTLVTVTGCKEEPLTPSSNEVSEGPTFAIRANVQGSPGLEKNILVKHANEWRIVQHQQTIVVPNN